MNLGASYSTDVPEQFCQLTTVNGCDSVAVLNLTINQPDTSFNEVSSCESYVWNGQTYNESGTYSYSVNSVTNNHSMSFDGFDDYVTVNNNLGSTSQMSISVWLNIENQSTGPKDIIGNWNGGNSSYLLSYEGAVQEISFICLGTSVSFPLFSSDFNTWINVSVNYDGSIISIYKNGQLMNSVNASGLIPQGSSIITFGTEENLNFCQSHWNNCSFEGYIDNLQIWNESLSINDIQNYMNCPPTGNEEGLVGYWNFEEGEGNTVYDLSGNENNGVINGAAYSTDVPEQSCQLTTVNGCDSVVTLDLTINNSNTGIDPQEHCDTYTWIDGNTYTSSNNTATFTLTNVAGCDSVVTLDLTMKNSKKGVDTQEQCDTYTWIDSTYTQSGTYFYNGGTSASNNYSMSFDGNNDYINGNLYNNFNNELSIGFWFKSNQLGQDCKLIYTGSWVNWSTRNFGIQHTNNGVKFILSIQGSKQYWVETGSNNIIDNLWHNVFATYDNNYIRLYIDGQIIDSLHVVGNINNVNDLFIGTRNPLGEYFNGNLDEVQLWNKALNQSEIEQFINCPPIGNESGLVGYWNFEEGEGNIVYDLSDNNNNGTIVSATYNTDIPEQSCQLTNVSGCDSTAILNLTINSSNTGIDVQEHCDT